MIRSIAHDQPQKNFKYLWLEFSQSQALCSPLEKRFGFPVDRICHVCLPLGFIADGARFFLRFALIRSVVPVWIQIDVAAISHSSKVT